MHQHFNTEGGSSLDREAVILACSQSVKAMAWWVARWSSLEVDELYSIGMLRVCEEAARAQATMMDPVGYLCVAARHAMLSEVRRVRGKSTVSLDAPLSADTEGCLADLISAPVALIAAPVSPQERALHEALERLSARQRVVLCRRYGLPGYGVQSRQEVARSLGASPNAVTMAVKQGRRKLACDVRLCEALGLEVTR